jgi:DNA-binding winged helix-turn-helix (wHTH) protein/tetratricopeptide (TPR) repeat protein
MGIPAESDASVRFGEFKLDLRTRELRSNGHKSYLQEQPFQILAALLDRPGQLVTRDQLMKQLWPSDTFVDFDQSLNKAVNRLREALDDSAEQPRFIETVPRRGYRFVVPVIKDDAEVEPSHARTIPVASSEFRKEAGGIEKPTALRRKILLAAGLLTIAALMGGGLRWRSRQAGKLTEKDTIVLADYLNRTNDPVFGDALRQALLASLEQSPFLNVLSDDKVREQLAYMGRPATDPLTEPVAREVCQRAGGKAVLVGSISGLGSHYALGLHAVNCLTGESMSRQETEAESREKILQSLDRISTKTREGLGESLSSIQQYDVPMDQVTTPSLEALRVYRLGLKTEFSQGSAAAIPFYKQAIELDQDFALAYLSLGVQYSNFGQAALVTTYLKRAVELSNRTSTREKLMVSAMYYLLATRQQDKAIETFQLWEKTYPRDRYAPLNLAGAYSRAGQYEQSAAASRRAIEIDPNVYASYANLAGCLIDLDRFVEAKKVIDEACSRKLDSAAIRQQLYYWAFLEGDDSEMRRQLTWAAGRPGEEEAWFLSMQADTESFGGRLGKAREYFRRAVDAEMRAGSREGASDIQAAAALREAEFGNLAKARKEAATALALSPGRDGRIVAAMALAQAGDFSRANALADDLQKTYPLDTLLQFYSLPAIRAAAELSRGNAANAETFIERTRPYELAWPTDLGSLFVVNLRGLIHLALHRGNDAAADFQTLLDHPGLNDNSPMGALAHLQIGRAYAMSGDPAKARTAYQDFLTLWKDADPDIPILKQAKAEYAKLQ